MDNHESKTFGMGLDWKRKASDSETGNEVLLVTCALIKPARNRGIVFLFKVSFLALKKSVRSWAGQIERFSMFQPLDSPVELGVFTQHPCL